jgi:hypothetical protein
MHDEQQQIEEDLRLEEDTREVAVQIVPRKLAARNSAAFSFY